jgi:ASC-1-like (ASCH) protein
MEYSLELNPRPFEAIKKGTKKIECRVPTEHNKNVSLDRLKKGDKIIFINNSNGGTMKVIVAGVRHYKDAKTMLESEGVENVLSSGGNIKQGVESYDKMRGYRENIKKHGIYAIEIKPSHK